MNNKLLLCLVTCAFFSSLHSFGDSGEGYSEDCYYRYGHEYCHRSYYSYEECLKTIWEPISTERALTNCKQTQPLKLATTTRSYPLLKAKSYTVEYWQGAWQRFVKETGKFNEKIYDTCNGIVVSEREVTEKKKYALNFEVINPNLSDSIDATYKLVPLTDEEADAALGFAEDSCINYKIPSDDDEEEEN